MTDASSHPDTADQPVIEMTDVTVQALAAPRNTVLQNVNWKVFEGDFWVVGGLQGSGKTDFLMLIAGMMGSPTGTYRLFGEILGSGFEQDTLASRMQVGLVFDGGQLLHHLTIRQNISLPIQYHRNCRLEDCQDRVNALIDLAGLEHCADLYPSGINRTWRQRVGLARALALKPKVLLVDCPLSGLDPRQIRWWQQMLESLSKGHAFMEKQPLTLIITDNNLVPWKHSARQFAILKNRTLLIMEKELAPAEHAEKLLHELLLTDPEVD